MWLETNNSCGRSFCQTLQILLVASPVNKTRSFVKPDWPGQGTCNLEKDYTVACGDVNASALQTLDLARQLFLLQMKPKMCLKGVLMTEFVVN